MVSEVRPSLRTRMLLSMQTVNRSSWKLELFKTDKSIVLSSSLSAELTLACISRSSSSCIDSSQGDSKGSTDLSASNNEGISSDVN